MPNINFNKLSDFITRDNITLALAIFGSIGTVINWIYSLYSARTNFRIKIVDIARRNGHVQIFLDIRNLSTNPLAISSISIKDGRESYQCELLLKKIREQGDILYRTPRFPLNIAPQTSCLYFLEFLNCPDIYITYGTNLFFLFDTNRGMKTKSAIAPKQGRYLHIG